MASARFAPDGTTVVFGMSTRDRRLALLSTRTDSVESRPLELPAADILGISRNGQMAVLLDRHNEGTWVSVGTLAAAVLAGGAPRPTLERANDGAISADGKPVERLRSPISIRLQDVAPDGRALARISHTLPAAAPDLLASTTFLAAAPPATCFEHDSTAPWSKRRADKHLRGLTTKVCEKCGLVVAGDTRAEIAGLLAGEASERRYEGWNDDYIGGLDADGTMLAGNMQVATVGGECVAFARRADGSPPVRFGNGDVFGMSPDGRWVYRRKLTGDRARLTLLPTGPGEPRLIDLGGVRPDDSARADPSAPQQGHGGRVVGPAKKKALVALFRPSEGVGLARISHRLSAATAETPAIAAFLPAAPPAACLQHASAAPG